jgi:hypothetical protein
MKIRLFAVSIVGTLTLAAFCSVGRGPDPAAAASCTVVPEFGASGNTVIINGGSCKDVADRSETFVVSCVAGGIRVHYTLSPDPGGPTDSGYPCASWGAIEVRGYSGPDTIDLSQVSAANGFTAMTGPNRAIGDSEGDQVTGSAFADNVTTGDGADTVLVRDGRSDSVDCGPGQDAAQADQQSVDSVANCEITSFLAEPVTAIAPVTTAAAATKKCKKKRRSAAAAKKKRCKKKRP